MNTQQGQQGQHERTAKEREARTPGGQRSRSKTCGTDSQERHPRICTVARTIKISV